MTDALDAALALLQPGRIPGQVDIDERAQALQVQALRCSVGAQHEFEFTRTHAALEYIAVATLKPTITPKARAVAACVEPDVHARKLWPLGHLVANPAHRVVILREQDAATL